MNLQKARRINAHYGDNYGGHKAPDHPEWTEIAGDRATRIRANYPTWNKGRYWHSKQYNQFSNNLLTTGALNRRVVDPCNNLDLRDKTVNPPRVIPQNRELQPKCVSDATNNGTSSETIFLGFLVVFLGVVFLMTLSSE